jgi:hypothetical protein
MRRRIFALALTAILTTGIAFAQSPNVARVLGVWRAQMNGLPIFTLVVTDENGGLSGAVLFYLLKREDLNHRYTATPGLPEPILNPKFDGKTLTFQVSHRRAHPPRTLSDPPVTFELSPTEDGAAQLINKSEGGPITLIRTDY